MVVQNVLKVTVAFGRRRIGTRTRNYLPTCKAAEVRKTLRPSSHPKPGVIHYSLSVKGHLRAGRAMTDQTESAVERSCKGM